MLIIFNFIGAGILIVAFALGCAIGYALDAKTGAPVLGIGLIAMALDLYYRWKVRGGEWFHPRRGGHISFIPVWIIGLGFCATGALGWNRPFDWRDAGRFAKQNNQPSLVYGNTAPAPTSQSSDGLKLNMISGTGPRGLAMINGETLGVGEKHRFKVAEKTVTLTCLEIHDHSVVAKIEGEAKPLELKMGETTPLAMAR